MKLQERKERIARMKSLRDWIPKYKEENWPDKGARTLPLYEKGREEEYVGTKQSEYESYGRENEAFLILSFLFS